MRRFASLAAALSVLLLAAVVNDAAANGLNLGRGNTTSKGTTLRSKGGPTLTLANTGGKPAARFNVLKGKPPFAVSSRVKVIGLNADLLDGLDSSAFQFRVTGGCAAGSAIRVINPNGTVTCVSTLSPTPPPSWNLNGNAGTNPATNFLGTTDGQPLVIRTNNAEALRVTTNGNVGIGTTTPAARIDASATNAVAVNGTANGTVAEPAVTGTSSVGNGIEGTSTGSNNGVLGKSVSGAGVRGESTVGAGDAVGVLGLSGTQAGVSGTSASSDGVRGGSSSGNGVNGTSSSGVGVQGTSSSQAGVSGNSQTAAGVVGQSGGPFGVLGTDANGIGVSGESVNNVGVSGTATSQDGVIGGSVSANGVGGTSDTGFGVSGASTSGSGVKGLAPNDGVLGISSHPFGGSTAAAVRAINTGGGDIFIGAINNTSTGKRARIDSTGKGFFDGGTANTGADYAEAIRASGDANSLAPGDVLTIDAQHADQVTLSDSPQSQLVAGVYSTKPSVLALGNRSIDSSLAGTVPVAMLGLVPTKVSAENGAIRPGDLLTTARTPGYAMKARPVLVGGVTIYPTGTILGKALAPLAAGHGTIEVLLMMR